MNSPEVRLDVPYHQQCNDCSCFPTCVTMALEYYNDTIDSIELYNQATLPGHGGTWDILIAGPLLERNYRITSYWTGSLEGWNVPQETLSAYNRAAAQLKHPGYQHRDDATWELLTQYVRTGTPVIAEVNANQLYHRDHDYTHMVTVIGMSGDTVVYHDPHRTHGGPAQKHCLSRNSKRCGNNSRPPLDDQCL